MSAASRSPLPGENLYNREVVERILEGHGYQDYRWARGTDILVSQWVRFKCTFGCSSFGKKGTCPPAVPSIPECREFFMGYDHVLVIHIPKKLKHPDDRKKWSLKANLDLLKVEKAVFLAGYQKAFLLFLDECRLCADCPGTRSDCKMPDKARPSPEALGVDVFGTVRRLGYPIEVLSDYAQEMNRYAFLLVG